MLNNLVKDSDSKALAVVSIAASPTIANACTRTSEKITAITIIIMLVVMVVVPTQTPTTVEIAAVNRDQTLLVRNPKVLIFTRGKTITERLL